MSNLQIFNQKITDPKTQAYLDQVLSSKKSSFVNNIVALVSNNTALQACEPMSVMFAGLKATALDLPLDPNLGFAYVIPYKNNRENKTEAQFQIGYKGFIQLAIRSGQFLTINATEIKEGEVQNVDILTGEMKFKAVADRHSLPAVGYAAYFKLLNGFEKTLYMTKEEVDAHAKKYSQTYSSKYDKTREKSKWTTDFDAMAKKTVLKLLLSKYAPLSIELTNAITSDQAVITESGNRYVDNDIDEATAEEIRENANETTIGLDPNSGERIEQVVNKETGEVISEKAVKESDEPKSSESNAPGF